MQEEIRIYCPSGIGDISWMISKFANAPERERIRLIPAGGWPNRAHQYLELLPWLKAFEYGNHDYADLVQFQQYHGDGLSTWKKIVEAGFGGYFLEPNSHLEKGWRLEAWLPDLATDFHYEMVCSEEDKKKADALLRDVGTCVFGLSAASYRGAEAWHTWKSKDWIKFLGLWKQAAPEAEFLMLGGCWDDLSEAIACSGDVVVHNAVGKTTVGAAVEALRRLRGYVGFSSGLGILGTVVNVPVFMMWPAHQAPLATSWVPPEMLDNGAYMSSLWLEPEEVFLRFRKWLRVVGV